MQWIIGINALRFFAIALIVIYHLFRSFLPGGFIAVEIFFTLSGFFIVSKLVEEYRENNGIKYFRFIGKRLARILPGLLICIATVLLLSFLVHPDIVAGIQKHALAAVTFTTNIIEILFGGGYENTISPNLFEHTWFIALEMQFYLLVPIIVKLMLGQAKKIKTGLKALLIFFILFGAFSMALMMAYGGIFHMFDRAYFAPDSHLAGFCFGAAFAVLNNLIPRTPRTKKFLPSLGVLLSLVIIVILSFKLSYQDSMTYFFGLPFTSLLTVIMIFCIIKLQPNWRSRRKVPAVLIALEKLGEASYGIYLFHWPLFILFGELFARLDVWFAPTLNIILSLIAGYIISRINFPRFWQYYKKAKPAYRTRWGIAITILIVPVALALVRAPLTSSIAAQLEEIGIEGVENAEETGHDADYIGIASALRDSSTALDNQFKVTLNPELAYKHNEQAAPNANAAKVLVIGDSVTLGAKVALETTIPGTFVDAKESRGIETATGIIAGYKATGKLPEIIVISLATNERTITDSLLQNIVNVAGNDRKFILVTAYAGPQQPRDRQNAALKDFASKHDNVYIADWWTISHDNWSLMYADHIHLNPEGRMTYANLIYNVVRSM
jgi:Predicted acyltransferases